MHMRVQLPIVLHIGWLPNLLDAFAQVARQDAHLHLLMAGPDQTGWAGALKTQADKLGITDRISWPGMLQLWHCGG